jgi:hypothetical protein
MLKKALLVLVLALQFGVIAGRSLAYDPEPGCGPCPEDPPVAVR